MNRAPDTNTRRRSVGKRVLTATVGIPAPPARLVADWRRETVLQLDLQAGDVESLPLARARARWPQYRRCVDAVSDWLRSLGLQDLPTGSEVALMACRGARYHHDAADYSGAAFCNLFLSDDKGQDVHFPVTGQRIPLVRGTVLLFDTCQPHAVIARHSKHFDLADFPSGQDCTQVFLTWEIVLGRGAVAKALQINFDADKKDGLHWDGSQLLFNGLQVEVCPASGQWREGGIED